MRAMVRIGFELRKKAKKKKKDDDTTHKSELDVFIKWESFCVYILYDEAGRRYQMSIQCWTSNKKRRDNKIC